MVVERVTNEKMLVEGSVGKDTANKKWKLIHLYLDYWEFRPIAIFIFDWFIFFLFQ